VSALERLAEGKSTRAGLAVTKPAPQRRAEAGARAPRFGAAVLALLAVGAGLGIYLAGDDGEQQPGANFSSPSGLFSSYSRGNASAFFEGDSFMFDVDSEPFPVLENSPRPGDVRVNVKAKEASSTNDFGVGILCHASSRAEYYVLGIQSGGLATITKYVARRGRPLVPSQPFDVPETGRYQLQARCEGTDPVHLRLNVNHRLVAEAFDSTNPLTGTSVGLRASAGTGSRVKIQFDDFDKQSL
jgi:hypothetical protein